MVQNNKVLTVSYGTFSCTLEGFEDSFGTMTAIAEYFRDLAADDRYFGAEPPQPDADMLAQIAQREIARRVEAHTEGSGIVLRAGEQTAAIAAAPSGAPAPQTPAADAPADTEATGAPATDATLLADVAAGAAQDPVAEPVVAEMPEAEIVPADSIADKLQRIRAVVSRSDAAVADAEFTEDEHAEGFIAGAAEDIADALEQDDIIDAEPSSETEDDLVDDVLSRFDASVRQDEDHPVSDAQTPEIVETVAAEEPVAETEYGQVEMTAEDAPAEAQPAQDDAAGPEGSVTAPYLLVPEDQAPGTGTAMGEYEEEDEDLFADLATAAEDASDSDDDEALQNILSESGETQSQDNEAEADRPMRPQVLKVKRTDFDAAMSQASLQGSGDASAPAVGSLSAEDEADLMRELAAVEAEINSDLADAAAREEMETEDTPVAVEDTESEPPEAEPIEPTRADLSGTADDDADNVSRLMAEADSKMDEPENSLRREAYNHLRAAVAATQAEKSITGETAEAETDDDAYRSDLASVVRPRRPAAGGSGHRRPQENRPAPLKLVAEQRVDIDPDQANRGPVRPRRVAAAFDERGAETEGGFASFAEENGAKELPELLEAAAAYMSFVEGHEQFSRPQLMSKVRQVEKQDFNREDGLRSFGQLLRDGKIEKTGGGRFTASDQIGFKPQERAAG